MKTLSLYICLFLLCISCAKDDDGQILNNLNDITLFSINGQQGTIDTNTITFELDSGTDITALTPDIEHTGLRVVPADGVAQDFTNPVTYTVVAEDGSTQEFTVTVTISLGTATGIEFITTWFASEITIPTNPEFIYNYNVDWNNDGIVDESGITGNVTRIFDTNVERTIRITGTFPAINFGGGVEGDEANNIISVDQWGTGIWLSMESAFASCENLKILATDIPDLSSVTNMEGIFANTLIVNPDVSDWEIGNVTSLRGAFFNAESANPDISNWNISNVSNAAIMFENSALSTENYDKLLISFANQTRQNNVFFDSFPATFCSDEAAAAKAILVNESNWRIIDGGRCE
ncbi:BspA family leucine-rich repeat surface protein [uncultured Aquimarina sp.]|uniref:BspA family leucine-rich repeat surface protein n=1 Tax=uncultured Aquimarina sp. TaxID=575652 RepID=UPI002601A882|nr:BspA family leucine-rich repeat surface protein [uncultured Aquimarina sp.]